MHTAKLVAGILEIMYIEYLTPMISLSNLFGGVVTKEGQVNMFLVAAVGTLGMAIHMIATRYEEKDLNDGLIIAEAAIVAICGFIGFGRENIEHVEYLILAGAALVNFAICATEMMLRYKRSKEENNY